MSGKKESTSTRVTLGNANMDVPTYRDPKTTREIAERVTHRLKAIEQRSKRIDTQAFALQLAFEFAAELDGQGREHDQDTREMLLALDDITSKLRDLANSQTK